MERRNFLRTTAMAAIASVVTPALANFSTKEKGVSNSHLFIDLPYSFDALEPYIDAQTMELHYSKHHKGYYSKFMKEIKGSKLEQTSMPEIFKNIKSFSEGIRNNGGGYYNHTLFWKNLSPNGGKPSDKLEKHIIKTFGSLNQFKDEFFKAAKTQFGSGWAWLVIDDQKQLKIGNTPNQDNPWMPFSDIKGTPLIAFDVWEHAYYLKYQNKRGDYINAFWNILNWNEVNKRYAEVI